MIQINDSDHPVPDGFDLAEANIIYEVSVGQIYMVRAIPGHRHSGLDKSAMLEWLVRAQEIGAICVCLKVVTARIKNGPASTLR